MELNFNNLNLLVKISTNETIKNTEKFLRYDIIDFRIQHALFKVNTCISFNSFI